MQRGPLGAIPECTAHFIPCQIKCTHATQFIEIRLYTVVSEENLSWVDAWLFVY